MRVLVLDDDDNRHNRFREWLIGTIAVHVHTADAAIEALKGPDRYDLVCLDHDLDLCTDMTIEETGTGQDVADWIARVQEPEKWPRAILIHSHNDRGAESMRDELLHTTAMLWRDEFGQGTGMVLAVIGRNLKQAAE